MNSVAVVYWSGTGNTQAMAEQIAKQTSASGAQTSVFTPEAFSPEMVDQFDVIAFGCPSMGAEELEESEFEPMFTACLPKLSGKKIALFGSYGWGDGEWMRTWEQTCKQNGAVLVCDSVICNEMPDAEALEACTNLAKSLIS